MKKIFKTHTNYFSISFFILFFVKTSFAIELVQEPPLVTSKSAFVAPNVILSIDDSGSMNFCLNAERSEKCILQTDNSQRSGRPGNYSCSRGWELINSNCTRWIGATDEKEPINGVWPVTSKRINVLKDSLKKVFSDADLIPDSKIRLAWQAMHGNGKVKEDEKNVNSERMKVNSMRPIKGSATENGTHRKNFLDFVNNLEANNGTPSHLMFSQADAYMRRELSKNSPWSSDPGGNGSESTEYLGCRRNYHILMTDGRWTGTATGQQQDGKNWPEKDKRQAYSITSEQTQIYRDNEESTLADWAFKSWADPLQTSARLLDADKITTSSEYTNAKSELFTKTKTVTERICTRWERNRPQTDDFCTNWKSENVKKTKTVNLEKYWNPKYNPATWPHMVTYTIGFSDSAIQWPGADSIEMPSLVEPIPNGDTGGYLGYDKGFVDLVTGFETWPNMNRNNTGNEDTGKEVRSLDLWHAAINGRGRFYPVSNGSDLEKAFRSIIGKINKESESITLKTGGGGSTSGYNLGLGLTNAGIFASVYDPNENWSGYITATNAFDPEEYSCPEKDNPGKKCIRFPDVTSDWNGMNTAQRLDAVPNIENRLILSWNDTPQNVQEENTQKGTGAPFKLNTNAPESTYSITQLKKLLGLDSNNNTELSAEQKNNAKNIIDYIRGNRSLENSPASFRTRTSRHGDIVNSEIWYTGSPIGNYAMGYSEFVEEQINRTPILYVGANDGMLHGFSANDGTEKIAYIPRGVISTLRHLTDPNYSHRYYVDGSPMTGDIKDNSTWKTLLVGTLGAGGKGYFLLDVTKPNEFSESNAKNIVLADHTFANNDLISCSGLTGADFTNCDAQRDLGNITAHPVRNPANLQETSQITRLNNGRWAAVMGNGYNSTNQRPVLLVQYLDGSKELLRIPATPASTLPGTGNANDNGLASPTLLDLNADGMADIAYAGDNLGNIWKFDLTSPKDSEWNVAFNQSPFFTARGPIALKGTRNQIQPITAAPIVRANDRYQIIGSGNNTQRIPIGGLMVAFGTGRNLTNEDRRTDIVQNVQTLYSIQDNTRYRLTSTTVTDSKEVTHLEIHPGESCTTATQVCTPIPAPTAIGLISSTGLPLAQQVIENIINEGSITREFSTIKPNSDAEKLTAETWSNFKGWYLDFPSAGERLLKPMQFYDGSNILAVFSETPNGVINSESDNINESCVEVKVNTSEGQQYRTLINIMDGARPSIQLVDYNDDGVYNHLDKFAARAAIKRGTPILITKRDRIVDETGGTGDILARMPESPTRPSWRQLK